MGWCSYNDITLGLRRLRPLSWMTLITYGIFKSDVGYGRTHAKERHCRIYYCHLWSMAESDLLGHPQRSMPVLSQPCRLIVNVVLRFWISIRDVMSITCFRKDLLPTKYFPIKFRFLKTRTKVMYKSRGHRPKTPHAALTVGSYLLSIIVSFLTSSTNLFRGLSTGLLHSETSKKPVKTKTL